MSSLIILHGKCLGMNEANGINGTVNEEKQKNSIEEWEPYQEQNWMGKMKVIRINTLEIPVIMYSFNITILDFSRKKDGYLRSESSTLRQNASP